MINPENIRSIEIVGGKVSVSLEVARDIMLAVASSAIALLQSESAPNFIEMELKPVNDDLPHMSLTIQYRNRPTPLEVIKELRSELIFIYNQDLQDLDAFKIRNRMEMLFEKLGYGDMLDG